MRSYCLLTALIAPLVPFWLIWRRVLGKEDPARIKERLGISPIQRPPGMLLWLHAASVGEANSILVLIAKIRECFSACVHAADHRHCYLGKADESAAAGGRYSSICSHRHPAGDVALHAALAAGRSILRRIGILAEPGFNCRQNYSPVASCASINGRMSEHSFAFRRWQKYPAASHRPVALMLYHYLRTKR